MVTDPLALLIRMSDESDAPSLLHPLHVLACATPDTDRPIDIESKIVIEVLLIIYLIADQDHHVIVPTFSAIPLRLQGVVVCHHYEVETDFAGIPRNIRNLA